MKSRNIFGNYDSAAGQPDVLYCWRVQLEQPWWISTRSTCWFRGWMGYSAGQMTRATRMKCESLGRHDVRSAQRCGDSLHRLGQAVRWAQELDSRTLRRLQNLLMWRVSTDPWKWPSIQLYEPRLQAKNARSLPWHNIGITSASSRTYEKSTEA